MTPATTYSLFARYFRFVIAELEYADGTVVGQQWAI